MRLRKSFLSGDWSRISHGGQARKLGDHTHLGPGDRTDEEPWVPSTVSNVFMRTNWFCACLSSAFERTTTPMLWLGEKTESVEIPGTPPLCCTTYKPCHVR